MLLSKFQLSRAVLTTLAFAVFAPALPFEKIHIRGQMGKAKIDEAAHTIFVPVNYYGRGGIFPLESAYVEEFVLPKGTAHTLPDTVDLRDWHAFKIGEEEWKIKGGYQLPGSDFTKWHTEDVPGFATFGRIKCDEMVGGENQHIWDNGNPAYSTSGSKSWPTKKVTLKDGTIAAELETQKVFGVIASGNLFTGRIVREWSLKRLLQYAMGSDGKNLIKWGVPFTGRPKAVRVKFKYEGKGDTCTVMTSLENRKDGTRRYIATAWYSSAYDNDKKQEGVISISEPDENGLRTLEMKFIYGTPHKNADPLPDNAVHGKADEEITHINVVFGSSRRGDYFKGVKGAKLTVSKYELIY